MIPGLQPLAFFRSRVPSPAPHAPTPDAWSDDAITLAWLGHSTVLMNFYGLRIVTDPVLFPRIGIALGVGTLGPKRLIHPAVAPGDLPDCDLVLVSHAHFDHLDIPSLAAIRGLPAAVMAAQTSDLLPRARYSSVAELRWEESTTVHTRRGDVRIRAIEVNHWGARVQRDSYRGYCGYVLEREGQRLLFGGDTAATAVFRQHRRHGPFSAAIMPIGGYDPWIRYHCTPEQSVAMADAAGAGLFLPVHHQCFRLSREPVHAPIERTRAALAAESDRLGWQDVGQTTVLPG